MKKQILLDNLEQLEKREYTKLTPMLVPENWEELKELVNKYSGKINRQVGGITVGTIRIIIMMKFDSIYFGKNGNIYFADKFLGTYTPARQWQIIKSLIGEER